MRETTRRLGMFGPTVSSVGLGCMGMSEFYGPTDLRQAEATFGRALELGITLFDTADAYGPYSNEELVGRALAPFRDQVTISTKFGFERDANGSWLGVRGDRDYVHAACEASLRRLGVEHIDIYLQHRVDPSVPIEETVGAMAELVESGKVRYIGLSEAGPETISRAHYVHPISVVQTEYSLWSREVEIGVLPTLRRLGVGLAAYSPLGRGFLSGRVRSPAGLASDDARRTMPRFLEPALSHNLGLVEALDRIATDRGASRATVAISWVLSRGDDVVPIVGTTQPGHLDENVLALDFDLQPAESTELERAFAQGATRGDRYPSMDGIEE